MMLNISWPDAVMVSIPSPDGSEHDAPLNQASLDPRNYGYRKLSDLIEGIGLFDLKRENLRVLVRDKRVAVRSTTS
jgi:hypothetical protein